MDTRKILSELRSERDRINQAIAAIEAISPDGVEPAHKVAKPATGTTRKRRRISAAGRKRLSEMMKARWASGKMGRAKKRG